MTLKILYYVIVYITICCLITILLLNRCELLWLPIYKLKNNKRDPCCFRYNSFYKKGYYLSNSRHTKPFKIKHKYNTKHTINKIFSMSLYGTNPKYFDKLYSNIKRIRTYLPEWGVRVYLHEHVGSIIRNKLIYYGVQVYIVEDPACEPGKSAGAFWRFLPLCEPLDVVVMDTDDHLTSSKIKVITSFFKEDQHCLIYAKWCYPWPKQHINAGFMMKKKELQLPFDKVIIYTYPYRYEFGQDEIFLSKYIGNHDLKIYREPIYFLSHFCKKMVL